MPPPDARVSQGGSPIPSKVISNDLLYTITDALDEVSKETGKSIAQVSLNWLLQRPTVDSIIFGARNEEQLKQNLGAVGWNLTLDQVKKLDAASDVPAAYPYWHQRQYRNLNAAPKLYSTFTPE